MGLLEEAIGPDTANMSLVDEALGPDPVNAFDEIAKTGKRYVGNTVSALKVLSFPAAMAIDAIRGDDRQKARIVEDVEGLRGYVGENAPNPNLSGVGRFALGALEMAPDLATGGVGFANILAKSATNRAIDVGQQGATPEQATATGLKDLVTAGAMSRLPFVGKTAPRTIARGGLMNVAAGAASRATDKPILGDLAGPILDAETMGHDFAFGAGFGLKGYEARKAAEGNFVGPPKPVPEKEPGFISTWASPENLYLSALKPRTGKKGLSPEDRMKVADMALKNEIVINRKGAGLDKVLDMLDKTNRDIESVITAGEKRNQTIPVDLIATRLSELRKNAALDLDPDAVAAIDMVEQQLRQHPKVKNISVVYEDGKPKAVGGELSVQDAQDLKRRIYTTLRKHYGEKKSDEIEARKNVARGIKEELNNTFPELQELNATDSTQIKLEQALYDATRRIQNRDVIGIGGPIKIGAGMATGKPGAILGAAAAILDMPSVKSQLAITLYKARNRARRLKDDQRGMVGEDINATRPNAQGMYSVVENIAETKLTPFINTNELIPLLKKFGAKDAEIADLGLAEAFSKVKRVSKVELLDAINQQKIQVKEVVKGGTMPEWRNFPNGSMVLESDAPNRANLRFRVEPLQNGRYLLRHPGNISQESYSTVEGAQYAAENALKNYGFPGQTKFSQYTLPGGENYRELLMTVPDLVTRRELRPGVKAEYDEAGNLYPAFSSSHWDEPNVLAHIRFNDRTGPNGERLLHVEEFQSDWDSKVREHGVADVAERNAIRREVEALGLNPDRASIDKIRQAGGSDELANRFGDNFITGHKPDAAPKMPFSGDWRELTAKRMLTYAAQNGYDGVTWVTGEQTAARYDLSKLVKEIEYEKRPAEESGGVKQYRLSVTDKGGENVPTEGWMTLPEIEKTVGKDVAKKIENGEGKRYRGHEGLTLEGLDLKVGGEWAKTLYDQKFVSIFNKLAKKWGGKVGETAISAGVAPESYNRQTGPDRFSMEIRDKTLSATVHHLALPEQMAKDIKKGGLALYSATAIALLLSQYANDERKKKERLTQ